MTDRYTVRMSHYLSATGPKPYVVTVFRQVGVIRKEELFTFARATFDDATELFSDFERLFNKIDKLKIREDSS